MPELLSGLGVSAGTATGPVYRLADPPRLATPSASASLDARASLDAGAEERRAFAAIDAVGAFIERRAAAVADETAADILHVQAALVADRALHDLVARAVHGGLAAPHAVAEVLDEHRAALIAAGGPLAARAADLDDLRDRIVAHCLGLPMPELPEPGCPYVLLASDLAPADVALLDPERVLAVVTSAGSYLSHTAILARARGLPTVVACTGALDIPDGTPVTVDGTTGCVTVGRVPLVPRSRRGLGDGPSQLRGETPPVASTADLRGRTADGHPVALLANIACAADLAGVSVEGVGLFRTELLFPQHLDPPSEAEQAAAYAEVFAAVPGCPVVIRTFDAGSDKPLSFLGGHPEPNPALGLRGLRLARRHSAILDTQLSAIAAAAHGTSAWVSVLAPMVTTVAEAEDFAARCHRVGLRTVGAMIEVPAAVIRVGQLLQAVDFLSIGTNDLSQYAFAADRRSAELADLLDPWQPALLSLVAMCAAAGTAAGRPVGVCGEAAADPAFAVVLAGLGITSLSMAPAAVPAVRAQLQSYTMDECQAAAQRALAAPDAATARAAVGGNLFP
ncbi:putative PEP-binding protein [Actinoplanes sp. NPDC051859]|uniref:putative PEP-binding protein n=1 Tax=Actinoplanes sp. NPDC051859 TaxID=3363909 RepID=UPI0037B9D118